jgi:choline dehydrogenase-like flavoprotein
MPAVDLRSRQDDSLARLDECDVCIVGTGPAGATLVRELSGTNLRVTVLESGAAERGPESDALDQVESVGRGRNPDQWAVRNRVVGGARTPGVAGAPRSTPSTSRRGRGCRRQAGQSTLTT